MEQRLIIFDLDGTLTESGPGVMKSVAYAFEKMNIEAPDEVGLRSFVGPPMVVHLQENYGMSEEDAKTTTEIFRERYNKIGIDENSLYDGIERLLKKLKEDGHVLSVATSKPQKVAKIVLEQFNIDGYFSYWQGAVNDTGRADKMDIVEGAIDGNGFENKKDMVFLVGDRKYDAMGASLCKIGFYGAGWGYAPEGELESFSPLGIAKTPDELYAMMTENFKEEDTK